jgi:hypothetical protein
MSTYGVKNSLAKKFSVLILTATSASHPIIYGALHQEFALGFKAFLRCSRKARKDFVRMSIRRVSWDRRMSYPARLNSFRTSNAGQATEESSLAENVQMISVV